MSCVSFSYGWNYDVFLSFRGSDTRHGFTGHLYKALCDRGIHTFIDDEELQRGEEITPSLLKAIQESRIAIPVFSKNYASSTFCLDELVSILACFKEKGRLVVPVFYDVDPSHVRHQIGTYEEALNSHKERFHDQDKLQKWRTALREAADFSGYHFKHGSENEYEFIGKIVIEVSQKVNRTLLHVADYPVGLESPLLHVNSLLNIESGGVHMLGIYGIGGVGKTTIARAIYNLIADQFEGLCFLDNVRENSVKHGLVHLQEALLSKSIGENGIKLGSVNEGIPIIKHRLHLKKVLLVLDDVDKLDQLQATVGGTDWFGPGSRIIITTRDRHLLKSHAVEKTYEVDMLNEKEAFKLLSWSAFKTDKVDSCYQNILNRVVTYTSGLPLALEVIGSNLFGKRIEEWESSLDQYERIPNKKIQDILRVSFDSLEEDEQEIFLDIACCFKGYALTYVKEILSSHHGFHLEYGIGVLIDKSLVKIDACGRVALHDLIEDMGKEIVRKESPEKPGKRSRLWCPEDIVEVLEENKGTSRIQIIYLDYLKYEVEWNGMGFKEMTNLKTLIIRDAIFTNGPKHLPNSLRVLEWWRYPSSTLPFEFHPKKLVILRLPYSCFCSMSLSLLMSKKIFMNMRVLNFNGCHYITEIPDVCGVPNLQELSFRYCENLIKIHESVGFLEKLKTLDADGCSKLRSFPPIKLTSLQELGLTCCPSLESFPKILGKMDSLTYLCIRGTPIKELPFSIQNLTQLGLLELMSCGIVQLPSSIFGMQELRYLAVSECEGLLLPKEDKGEEQISSTVFGNTIDLKECRFLTNIEFKGCGSIQEIRGVPPNVETFSVRDCSSLKDLDLTVLPKWAKDFHCLRKLHLYGCNNLQNIKGIPVNIEVLMVNFCPSLKNLDLTLPPACTQECRILSILDLDNCESLQEIKGVLSNISAFSARDCQSLTSECRSKLLNKELHEAGGCKEFCLPGKRIPEWFEHCTNESSISFWFRNKFPAISVCAVIKPRKYMDIWPVFTFNGKKQLSGEVFLLDHVADHLVIFDQKQKSFEMRGILLENEWHQVECTINPPEVLIEQIGIHVFKQGSNMEDIQFTNPQLLIEDHILVNVSHGVVLYATIWENFWELMKRGNLLPKCLNLMWHACQNILPVRASRVKSKDTTDRICPMCGEAEETVVHALITCPEARQVWFASPLCLLIDPVTVISISQWVNAWFKRNDFVAVQLVSTLLWSIWNRRNQWVNKSRSLTISQVLSEAANLMMIPERTWNLTDFPLVIWRPPPMDVVKANFNVSVKEGQGTGMGAVFRNHDGSILAAATYFLPCCMNVKIAEARCFRWVLDVAKELELSFHRVVFESDCQMFKEILSDTLCHPWNDESLGGCSYLGEITNAYNDLFHPPDHSASFIRRQGNLLANKLSSLAFVYHDMCWIKDIPHQLYLIASDDVLTFASGVW